MVPLGIKAVHYFCQLACRPVHRKILPVINHSDFFPYVGIPIGHFPAEQPDCAAVFLYGIQNTADGGSFACSVFSHKAKDGAIGQ